ncbi:hypothetical protein ACP275_06G151800 [Erythranthe tilingii]
MASNEKCAQFSRCSPSSFRDTIDKVKLKMGTAQLEAIKSTPFGIFLNMSNVSHSLTKVLAVMRRFQAKTMSFRFGEEIEVPFEASEFSMVMGLRYMGQPIDELFCGKKEKTFRNELADLLVDLACKDDCIDDFCRTYILFVCNCVLFPQGNYSTPSFIFPYLEDLSDLGSYAWGKAVSDYLIGEMRANATGKKTYVNGCTIGLLAWFYERVPSIGSPTSLSRFPRFFRWDSSKTGREESKFQKALSELQLKRLFCLFQNPKRAS